MVAKQIVPLLALLSCVSCAFEIQQVQIDDAQLISTSQNNFGLSFPMLKQRNWKTVSVNGDNLFAVSFDCSITGLKLSQLSQEDRMLISNSRQHLVNMQQSNSKFQGGAWQQLSRSIRTTFSADGQSSSSRGSTGMSSFNTNGRSIAKLADDNFSISRYGLPDNMLRVFVAGDVVAFVYQDGRVQMKPTACLQPIEQQLISEIRADILQAEQQFQLQMQQFQQNMDNSMQNMHQQLQQQMQQQQYQQQQMQLQLQEQMQRMNQNLGNMFANGFY